MDGVFLIVPHIRHRSVPFMRFKNVALNLDGSYARSGCYTVGRIENMPSHLRSVPPGYTSSPSYTSSPGYIASPVLYSEENAEYTSSGPYTEEDAGYTVSPASYPEENTTSSNLENIG